MNYKSDMQFINIISRTLMRKFYSNKSDNNINKLAIETSIMKLKYPFLNEKQLRGKVYDKFNIPNYFGRILPRTIRTKTPKKKPAPAKKIELIPGEVDKKRNERLNIKTLTKTNSKRNSSPQLKSKKIIQTNTTNTNLNEMVSVQKQQDSDMNNNNMNLEHNKEINKKYLNDNNNNNNKEENIFNKSIKQEPEENSLLFSEYSESSYNIQNENYTDNLIYINPFQNSSNRLEKLNGTIKNPNEMLIDIHPIGIEKTTLPFPFSSIKSPPMLVYSQNEFLSPRHLPSETENFQSDNSSCSDLFGIDCINTSNSESKLNNSIPGDLLTNLYESPCEDNISLIDYS